MAGDALAEAVGVGGVVSLALGAPVGVEIATDCGSSGEEEVEEEEAGDDVAADDDAAGPSPTGALGGGGLSHATAEAPRCIKTSA